MRKNKITVIVLLILILSAVCVGCNVESTNEKISAGDGNSQKVQKEDNFVHINIYYNANIIAKEKVREEEIFDISQYLVKKEVSKICDASNKLLLIVDGKVMVEDKDIYIFLVDIEESFSIVTENNRNCECIVESTASLGQKIVFNLIINEDYFISEIKVCDSKGKEIEVTKESDGLYSFIMPKSNVKINVSTELNLFYIESKNIDENSQNVIITISEHSKMGTLVEGVFIMKKGYRVKNLLICDSSGLPLTKDELSAMDIKLVDCDDNVISKDEIKSNSKIIFKMPQKNIIIIYEEEKIAYSLTIINNDGNKQTVIDVEKYFEDSCRFILDYASEGYEFIEIIAYIKGDETKSFIDIEFTNDKGGIDLSGGQGINFLMQDNNIVIEVIMNKLIYRIDKKVAGCEDKIILIDRDNFSFGDTVEFNIKLANSFILENIRIYGENDNKEIDFTKKQLGNNLGGRKSNSINMKNTVNSNAEMDKYVFSMPSQNVVIEIVVWSSLESVWKNLLENMGDTFLKEYLKISGLNFLSQEIPKFATSEGGYETEVNTGKIPQKLLGKGTLEFYENIINSYNFISGAFKLYPLKILNSTFQLIKERLLFGNGTVRVENKYQFYFETLPNEINVKIVWNDMNNKLIEINIVNKINCIVIDGAHIIQPLSFNIIKTENQNTENNFSLLHLSNYLNEELIANSIEIKYSDDISEILLTNNKGIKEIKLTLPNKIFASNDEYDSVTGVNKTIVRTKIIDENGCDKWIILQEYEEDMNMRYIFDNYFTTCNSYLVSFANIVKRNLEFTYFNIGQNHFYNGQILQNLEDTYGGGTICYMVMAQNYALKVDEYGIKIIPVFTPMILINENFNQIPTLGWEEMIFNEFLALNGIMI